jgi:hypothetical protein
MFGMFKQGDAPNMKINTRGFGREDASNSRTDQNNFKG